MSRLNSKDLSNIKTTEELLPIISEYTNQLNTIINGGIQFGDNITSQTIDIRFSAANVDKGINHNLNKTGVRYLVVRKDVSCDIYHGQGSDTLNTIFLRSTVGNSSVTLILI